MKIINYDLYFFSSQYFTWNIIKYEIGKKWLPENDNFDKVNAEQDSCF